MRALICVNLYKFYLHRMLNAYVGIYLVNKHSSIYAPISKIHKMWHMRKPAAIFYS